VAEGIEYPLNCPPEMTEAPDPDGSVAAQIKQKLQWPIPFYADTQTPWPFTVIDFHQIARQIWPQAPLQPSLGYQKFLNWVYSMMANKIRVTCRDIILTLETLSEEVMTSLQHGADLSIVQLKGMNNKELKEIIDVLQMEPMNADIASVAEKIERLFEKASGLMEIMYGESPAAYRSAQEAGLKGDMTRIRPDDMINTVADAMSLVARKEGIAARLMLDPARDVQPVLGPHAASFWKQLVFTTDPVVAVRELEYRIEAGSAARPNRQLEIQNSNDAAQFIMGPLLQLYQATGNPGPVNAMLTFWCKARQLDPSPFLLPPLPPPLPPGAVPPGGPPPEGGPPVKEGRKAA
jgi:hypothetical protein